MLKRSLLLISTEHFYEVERVHQTAQKKFQRDKRRLALFKSDKQTFVALPYHIL